MSEDLLKSEKRESGFDLEIEPLRIDYNNKKYIYDALVSEVLFIVNDAINDLGIKIHNVEGRVKTFDSLYKKCVEKSIDTPFSMLTDIAGARIICLFRSDIDKIDSIISDLFHIESKDDKVKSGSDSFGYMSVHYICKMKREYNGPRYKKIRDLPFEIQVRTVSMHAWAVTSHYLDYKGEWDVPKHLKKSLNALSGLFYVADSEFESFYREAQESKSNALASQEDSKSRKTQASDAPIEINFDTVSAYLSKAFPKRAKSNSANTSDFVSELIEARYSNIKELENDIKKGEAVIEKFEELRAPKKGYYTAVGAARVILSVVSDNFLSARKGTTQITQDFNEFKKYVSQ